MFETKDRDCSTAAIQGNIIDDAIPNQPEYHFGDDGYFSSHSTMWWVATTAITDCLDVSSVHGFQYAHLRLNE